ncbi:heterokaryon incompatibility protein-domain-containing protein [Cladorrhinum sp. PSN332]|nr:heterokaryon incompatibility protein-domain-containing protein [Cladorrhinum sp. PSN332]
MSSTPENTYTYPPLKPGQIRLVNPSIEPHSTEDSGSNSTNELRVFLSVREVENYPEYHALSYTWGEAGRSIPINCDGKTLMITPSLHCALQAVFSSERLRGRRALWVDQICINQGDQREKEEQIKLMRDIYSRAWKVIVHLSPTTPSNQSDSGLELLRRVAWIHDGDGLTMPSTKFQRDYRHGFESPIEVERMVERTIQNYKRPESRKEITLEQSEKLGVSFDNHSSWRDFTSLYDHPWFERLWTTQEILLARYTEALWGTEHVPWERVCNAAWWYHHNAKCIHDKHPLRVDGIKAIVELQKLGAIWGSKSKLQLDTATTNSRIIKRDTSNKPYCDLRLLLNSFGGKKTTDPRDKVYGLLGLSHLRFRPHHPRSILKSRPLNPPPRHGRDTQLPPDLTEARQLLPTLHQDSDHRSNNRPYFHTAFTVDYSKDVKQVYTDITREIIRDPSKHRANLDVLLDATGSNQDFPSWVPDWRQPVSYGCREATVGKTPEWWHSRENSRHHAYSPAPDTDPFTLKVKARILGRVTHISPFTHAEDVVLDNKMREALHLCLNLLPSSTYLPTGEEVTAAYALTMMGGKIPDAITDKGTSLELYVESYLEWVDAVTEAADTERQNGLIPYWKLGFDESWIEQLKTSYCHRRFFITETGYMGLGNEKTKEGDVIAQLVGLSVPCALRPAEEHQQTGPGSFLDSMEDGDSEGEYEFVGEAYCHGAMDGIFGEPLHQYIPVRELVLR